ncbi:MAG: TetR/AcrR family transcriptional regulator [Gammaproteobacteria bacterium]
MDQEKDNNNKLDTSDEILLAALKLFAEKGYFNTSLTDITEATGIKTTSGLYQHFKSKQTIARALYDNILDSLSISIDDIRRRNNRPSEQLREVVGLLFRLTQEAPDVMEFLLVIKVHEFLPDEKPLLETAPFIKIVKIIQAGIKSDEIRNIDPLQAYTFFFGIIFQTLRMALAGSFSKNVEAYQAQAWMAAWNAICKK